jgi:signal peptidase I
MLVMTVTAWVVFAPGQLGGQAVYVIVNGKSMEPEFHFGDLVIARAAPVYQLGDIIVYHSAELNSLVFHRIVSFNLYHYILKGDNNSWIDSYQPTQAELIGKFWIRIPNVGNIVKWLQMPISMGILAGGLGVVLMAIFFKRSKRGKTMKKQPQQNWLVTAREWVYRNFVGRFKNLSKRNVVEDKQPGVASLATIIPDQANVPAKNSNLKDLGAMLEATLFILGFVALASLVMGIFAFTRPISADIADNVNFKQLGTFSYTTTARRSI